MTTAAGAPKATRRKVTSPRKVRADGQTRGRQDELFEVAAKIFYEKGYEATSIQDIADELGILKGSLYYYITTKEDLLFAILEQVHEAELQLLDAVLNAEGGPLERLRLLIESHVRANLENWRTSAIFAHDFRSLSKPHRRRLIANRDRLEGAMRELIEEGQKQSIFDSGVDPKILTLGILGMANSFHVWYREGGGRNASEIASQYTDFVIRGLLPAAKPARVARKRAR